MSTQLEDAEELLKLNEELAKKYPDSFSIRFSRDNWMQYIDELREEAKTK
ncbi:MAG: hypothetical protein KAJ03_11485 [Gammaproteobacteria bacterium]|nr:hypothetical protein [Gammaproteobacteria bacterium]